MTELYVTGMRLKRLPPSDSYLSRIPAVLQLFQQGLSFHADVTILAGENGAGKSTILEALAVGCGFNPEGGSRNLRFATQDTHSGLWDLLTVVRGVKRPRDGYFLRAESFYNMATAIDEIDDDHTLISSYGGRSLHRQSHGESFLSLVINRFGGNGLYLLDEPEAALSPSRQMALLSLIHELVKKRSQWIIATHSPILMAYPGAEIYCLTDEGIRLTPYQETEHYQLTRRFLENPVRMLQELFQEE